MPVPGDMLVSRTSLIDTNGPVIGATFSLIAYGPDGTLVTPDIPVELGNGVYEFSIQTSIDSLPGKYYLQATSDEPYPQVKEIEWEVRPIGSGERWMPGDTMVDYITVINPDAMPVINDSFYVIGFNTMGLPFTPPPPAEIGDGVYRVVVDSKRFDPPGSYYIQLTSQSFPTQVYEVEFNTGQPTNLIGGMSLLTLRRRVMARFGDIITCRATAESSEDTFIDEDNLVGEPGLFAGREAMFVNGSNAGQKRRIAGSSRTTSGVSFYRPLPYPVMVGDECDMTNAYGMGITFTAVDDAINYALDISRDRAHIPVNYSLSEWNGTSIPIPPGVVGINNVYAIDRNGERHTFTKGRGGKSGWFIDQASRAIVLDSYSGSSFSGMEVVVDARALPHTLTQNSDVTHIDAQWLIEQATAHLCLNTMVSRQATVDWGSRGLMYQQAADRLVSRLTPNLGVNYTAIQNYG